MHFLKKTGNKLSHLLPGVKMGSRKPIHIVLIWHNDSTFWKIEKIIVNINMNPFKNRAIKWQKNKSLLPGK